MRKVGGIKIVHEPAYFLRMNEKMLKMWFFCKRPLTLKFSTGILEHSRLTDFFVRAIHALSQPAKSDPLPKIWGEAKNRATTQLIGY